MNGAQVSAFQANSGIAPSAMATVLVGVVFAVLLVWGVWAIRTAYVGWAEIAHLQAHIKTLRLGAGALVIVALVMGGGWWSAPRDLTIHVPPDLRSGSTRKWWEVC